jgi:hypothetical protein
MVFNRLSSPGKNVHFPYRGRVNIPVVRFGNKRLQDKSALERSFRDEPASRTYLKPVASPAI